MNYQEAMDAVKEQHDSGELEIFWYSMKTAILVIIPTIRGDQYERKKSIWYRNAVDGKNLFTLRQLLEGIQYRQRKGTRQKEG